ncbi:MAG: retroviral-like aspartic protease family protein [Microscillaceae bacterium]|jgi:hypothetical protein|nr:retroviral-like aspartic protease family protein [Microscillaceae bacterium]
MIRKLTFLGAWCIALIFSVLWVQAHDTLRHSRTQIAYLPTDTLQKYADQSRFKVVFSNLIDTDSEVTTIPFRLSGNLILVEAELNQQNGWFIFDSGAPDLKLNSFYLQNNYTTDSRAAGGITGNVTNISLQTIAKFKWHQLERKNVAIESFDLHHIESIKQEKILGLIGYALFKDFEVLFDYKKSELVLYKLDAEGNRLTQLASEAEPQHQITFEMRRHVPIIKGKIGKQLYTFALDTGAELNVFDMRWANRVNAYFQITRRMVLRGNGQAEVEAFSGKLSEMQVGYLRFNQMRTVLTNLSEMNKAYNTDVDGILGFEFLSRRKTAINFIKQVLYMWENEQN